MVTDLASIWFGKRFDYHGPIAIGGIAHMPDLSSIAPISHYHLGPYNHQPRSDLNIELNLNSLAPVLCLLSKRQPQNELAAFWAATRFYARAFFHLVVALEVIASQINVPYNDLYDEQARQDLDAIEQKQGPDLANRVRSRYYQLRRRVVYAAKELVNDVFFDGSQAQPGCRLDRDRLEGCIKAAYDLRSKYAHAGMQFGIWLGMVVHPEEAEVQVGRPVLPDAQKELEEILANIPTFVGLERLVRFITLSFAHRTIEKIDERLQKGSVS
jgi:hypothetical protein